MTDKKFDPKEYKTEWIPVRLLAVVWEDAQRTFKSKWAQHIADDFDPDKFDHVKVTLPNGNGIYHICEGQHRTRAVEMKWGPNEKVPCIVAQESDPARAAEIFLGTNTNRSYVTKVARFKVAVTAKHPDEININRIVQHNGYRVEATHAQDTIAAVDALKFAYNKGKKTLDQTLHTVRQTWGGDPAAVVAPIVKGYASFICEFAADLNFEHLRKSVIKKFTSPNALMVAAKSLKDTMKISMMTAIWTLLLQTYNRGQRQKLKRKGD
jgi:hypothetical protein